MQKNLAAALAFIDEDEGPELNISPDEPGGSSKHGVSMEVLRQWHVYNHLPAPDMNDMRAVDAKLAGEIYATFFAVPVRFNDLPSGVDYRVVDIAVNAGVAGAGWILQDALGMSRTEYGKITDEVVTCATVASAPTLITALGAAWLAYKIKEAHGSTKYVAGWTNRKVKADNRALTLVSPGVPDAKVESTPTLPGLQPVSTAVQSTATEVLKPKGTTMTYPIKGKTASWKGIIGVGMDLPILQAYIDSLTFTWKPNFMVLHNTGSPELKQWHIAHTEQRMDNLTDYYKNKQHWSAGPHAFVADDLVWPFSPFTGPGVHAPSWNGVSIGIEWVGDYNVESCTDGPGLAAYRNVVALFGMLHRKLGLDPHTIRLHKEDPNTTHKDCPGSHLDKGKFISDVLEWLGEAGGDHPHTLPITPNVPAPALTALPAKTATVTIDNLNMRTASTLAAPVQAILKKGTKVEVLASANNGATSWTKVQCTGLIGWVATRFLA